MNTILTPNEIELTHNSQWADCNDNNSFDSINCDEYHPYLHHLINIEWYIFGTLTWSRYSRRRSSYSAEIKRRKDFNDLLKPFRIFFEIPRRKLLFYKATEFGAGELHVHLLIAKNNLEQRAAELYCNKLRSLWQSELSPFDCNSRFGIGEQVDIVPYDKSRHRPAVEYCCKREYDECGVERERYDYLSPALINHIQRMPVKSDAVPLCAIKKMAPPAADVPDF